MWIVLTKRNRVLLCSAVPCSYAISCSNELEYRKVRGGTDYTFWSRDATGVSPKETATTGWPERSLVWQPPLDYLL